MEHEPQSECTLIRTELVLYHFGEVDPVTRAAIERHLPGCVECVRAFLAVKREVETSPAARTAPVPSDMARARLKAAVLREIARPVPTWVHRFQAGALAAAAAVLVVVLVAAALDGRSKKTPAFSGSPVHIDSARPATPGLDLL